MILDQAPGIEAVENPARRTQKASSELVDEEKYSLIFSSMTEGFILGRFLHGKVRPRDFRIVETNNAFLKQMNVQRRDIINKTAAELMAAYKTERPFWLSVFSNIESIEQPIHLEYRVKRTDRWFHISISNVIDDYIAAIFEDITDRKKYELTLKNSETRYRLLFSNMNEGFILGHFLDTKKPSPDNFRITEVNDVVSEQTGVPIKNIVNKTATQVIRDLHLDESYWFSLFSDLKKADKPIRREYYDPNMNLWYLISAYRPMQNHLAAVFENITEQKRAEEKFRLLFSNMNEGFLLGRFIYNDSHDQPSDFQVLEINDTLLRQFRLSREIVLNKTVLEIISDFRTERPFWFSLFAQIQTNQPPIHFEYYFKRYDRWFTISFFSPMKDHLAAIIDDITERKKIEEQLRKQNQDLARRSEEVSESNKELESFSYSVSHDLRAPIRTIDGFSQALLEDYMTVLDEQGKDYLHRLHEGAQRMNEMIDAILRLSRETRKELHCEPINLTVIANGIITKLNEENPNRNIDVSITNLQGFGDKELLTTALTNLLRNAWKFTKNTPHPRIEFESISKNGETIYYVKDNVRHAICRQTICSLSTPP